MRENNLICVPKKYKAKRVPQKSKPRANKPNQYWGIDMTKFTVNSIGWIYLVILLDWYTKKIVGWSLSLRSRTQEWLEAVNEANNKEFLDGVRGQGLNLISDNGSQPTSKRFMQEMRILDINQIFTSYNNPKGNADTERVIRTIKEELLWIREFDTFEEAYESIKHWIEVDYNKLYVHSSLGYMSPEEFESLYYKNLNERKIA